MIVADSVLYQAILIFTNQDIPSYIKGGWHLRKAWKIYDKVHHEICTLKEKLSAQKMEALAASIPEHGSSVDANYGFQDAVVSSEETLVSPGPAATACSTVSNSVPAPPAPAPNSRPVEPNGNVTTDGTTLSEESLARLLGAVNFGYGTFQLCMSMVPPKILKLIEFLGFEGERDVGLACLDYTSRSQDMKAPLATLALLWYHTVLRPFFALDGANHCTGGDCYC